MTDVETISKLAAKFEALTKLADFSDAVVRARFEFAGKRCECTSGDCGHDGRCDQEFEWEDRGTADNYDAWQAHHWVAQSIGGEDHVLNCRILCVPCHKKTKSFGRSHP